MKSVYKYAKSYIVIDETKEKFVLSWSSYLVFFKNPKGGLILDRAYIFLGDIPMYFQAYYINFVNWRIVGNELYYCPRGTDMKVDPEHVHIHFHPGDSIFDSNFFKENPAYFKHFFSSPNNKIYLSIKNQLTYDKISVFNFMDTCPMLSKISIKERCEKFVDPRFSILRHQIYGEQLDHALYTGLLLQNL